MKQQELISFNATWDKSWEPFYISSRNVPLFDERFKQYGFDRIEQICELHIAGYKFPVLNNAFLVHDVSFLLKFSDKKCDFKFKGWKIKHEDDRKTETLQNLILFNFHFQQTLLKMYPNTGRTCAPVKPWIPGPHVRQNVLKKLTKNPNKLKRRHIKNFLRSWIFAVPYYLSNTAILKYSKHYNKTPTCHGRDHKQNTSPKFVTDKNLC